MKIPEKIPQPLLSGWVSDIRATEETSPKLPLSLVVITLNEERNIERCIRSVPFAKEIIVVDSFSEDKTVKIAETLGAKVIQRKFTGYRDQKQFAMEQAKESWILSLDADEALSPDLKRELPHLLLRQDADGFRIPRCSFHLNKWIRHGGWYPDYQNRLFKRGLGKWVGGEVHEHLEISGVVVTLEHDLQHFVFSGLSDQIDTNNEFSSLGAKDLKAKGESFSILKLVFRPMGKFLESYFWKRGFLDGAPGLIIALGAAQSLFLRYAKLWEMDLDR